jgi:hypothetical protein
MINSQSEGTNGGLIDRKVSYFINSDGQLTEEFKNELKIVSA